MAIRKYNTACRPVRRIRARVCPAKEVQKPFSCYCDDWLARKKPKVREATYYKYKIILEKHIQPRLGAYFPLEFCTVIIGNFTRVLLSEDQLAVKTVRDILVVLRSILKYTAAFFPEFPTLDICCPREQKKEMRVLSCEEQARFVTFLQTDMDACKFGLLLALFTGLRIGELCALQWKNVRLQDQTLRIAVAMQRLPDHSGQARTRIVIGPPKSDSSARTIPLPDCLVGLCWKMKPASDTAYILTGTDDSMQPRTLQYRIANYTHACGLEGVHAHTLRHTFATRAIEAGFELKSLSEILGHSTTAITLERYVHSSMSLKRANMNKLFPANLQAGDQFA